MVRRRETSEQYMNKVCERGCRDLTNIYMTVVVASETYIDAVAVRLHRRVSCNVGKYGRLRA